MDLKSGAILKAHKEKIAVQEQWSYDIDICQTLSWCKSVLLIYRIFWVWTLAASLTQNIFTRYISCIKTQCRKMNSDRPWHHSIGAKGLSSIYVMMTVNGPIHSLNKPLGNTTRKKKQPTKQNLSGLFFPRKGCCRMNSTHTQNPTSCVMGIDKEKDP